MDIGRKIRRIFVLLTILIFGIVSCTKKEGSTGSSSKDDKVNRKYNRIVAIDPAAVEMIYMLGGEDRIAGIARLENSKIWPEDKTGKLESVGTFINPSLEKIISLKPDLVIASFHMSESVDANLKANNIEIRRIQAGSVEDIFKNFREIAVILGKEEEAERIIAEKKGKLEEIKKMETSERKGIFVIAPTPMRVFGKGTLPSDIMGMLNIRNIAEGMEGTSPTLTPEYIIKENPDVILTFVKNPDEIVKANPQIKDVNAVKERKFIVLETNQVLRGSPRTIDYISDIYRKVEKKDNN